MRARDQARARREQRLERRDVELGVRRRELARRDPPLQREAEARGEPDPGRDVGLVVELGDDELVAGAKREGEGEIAEELRRGRAED